MKLKAIHQRDSVNQDHNTLFKDQTRKLHNITENKLQKLKVVKLSKPFHPDTSVNVAHADIHAAISTMKSFIEAAKRVRQSTEYKQLDTSELLDQLISLSLVNQNLFKQDFEKLVTDENQSPAMKNISLYEGRTLGGDCGGSTALGIFNFLTFIVYAFSLFVVFLQKASGSMANTFLPNILGILQNGRRKRDVEKLWNSVEETLLSTSVEESYGNIPQVLDEELDFMNKNVGPRLMIALLEVSGVQVNNMECESPLWNLTSSSFMKIITRALNGSIEV
ncbi:hypothetical protein SK128_010457 [Halocaridina rubra]|uniref:Uncharacterized protein n=1 Tax=Halocaridina rubra TaxID=373956 RepID=A0AAN8XVX1_HALRR